MMLIDRDSLLKTCRRDPVT